MVMDVATLGHQRKKLIQRGCVGAGTHVQTRRDLVVVIGGGLQATVVIDCLALVIK